MPAIQRSTLFGKLNPLAYKVLEGTTVFCKMRGNPHASFPLTIIMEFLVTPK